MLCIIIHKNLSRSSVNSIPSHSQGHLHRPNTFVWVLTKHCTTNITRHNIPASNNKLTKSTSTPLTKFHAIHQNVRCFLHRSRDRFGRQWCTDDFLPATSSMSVLQSTSNSYCNNVSPTITRYFFWTLVRRCLLRNLAGLQRNHNVSFSTNHKTSDKWQRIQLVQAATQ